MTWVKLFEDFSEIDALCQKWGIENYTINPDGTVDVDGNVNLAGRGLKALPVKFGRVSGSFYCAYNQLTTLEGAPKKVFGYFDCRVNRLTGLKGAPKEVGGYFYCDSNQLTTLEGAPKEVGWSFDCQYNQLTTLEGAPKKVGGYFDCNHNQLTTLEGAPKEVGGFFACSYNQLTTLKGAPKEVGDNVFYCDNNPLPKKVLSFKDKNYILKWQDDYGIWQSGKLNQFRWQQMINDYDLG
jgi:hypothetical protein